MNINAEQRPHKAKNWNVHGQLPAPASLPFAQYVERMLMLLKIAPIIIELISELISDCFMLNVVC